MSLAGRVQGWFMQARHGYHKMAMPRLASWPRQPWRGERVAVFAVNDNNITKAVAALLAARSLSSDGWDCAFLHRNYWFDWDTAAGDSLSEFLTTARRHYSTPRQEPRPEIRWSVNLPEKVLVCMGLNFFELVHVTLSNKLRVYSADLADPELQPEVEALKSSIAAALEATLRIVDIADSAREVALVVTDPLTVPNGAIATYFLERPHPRVRLYCLSQSYAYYKARRFASGEIMLSPLRSLTASEAYHAHPDEFFPWYEHLTDGERDQICREVVAEVRRGRTEDVNRVTIPRAIVDRIHTERMRGRPVYCMFGHLAYDRPLFDTTTVFVDMIDWVRRTLDVFRTMDALLLLKPHPVEGIFTGHQKGSRVTLASIVDELGGGPNVVVLPPEPYRPEHIAEFIDAGIVWRSTAFIELALLDKPALFCGPAAFYSDVLRPKPIVSLEDYSCRLAELASAKPSAEMRRCGAAILRFLNYDRVIPIDLLKTYAWLFGDNVAVSPAAFLRFLLRPSVPAGRLTQALGARPQMGELLAAS